MWPVLQKYFHLFDGFLRVFTFTKVEKKVSVNCFYVFNGFGLFSASADLLEVLELYEL